MATGQGNIVITADTSQAQRALGDLDKALNNLKSSTSFAAKALAVVAGAAGIGNLISQSLDLAGALTDTSEALGMSASALGVMQKGAKLVGVDAEALNGTLIKLNKNIGEALIKGSGGAYDALKRLGLSARDFNGMDTEGKFQKITEELLKIPNPAVRAAMSVELLGKQGPKMLQVAEEAKKLKEELIAMGIKLSDADIKKLDAAGDAIDKAGIKLKEGFMKALVELTPYIISAANAIGNMAPYIVAVTKAFIELVPYILAAFGGYMLANIVKIAGAISGVLVGSIRALTAAMMANPLTTLLVALTTLGTYIYTKFVQPLRDAGESAGIIFKYVADTMVNHFINGLEILITVVPRTFKMLYNAAKRIWAGEAIGEAIKSEFNNAITEVGKTWNQRRIKFVSDEEKARLDAIIAGYKKAGETGTKAVNDINDGFDGLNEAQEKALKALNETISKLQLQADYQRDVLSLGEDEAKIKKIIAEEQAKLAEVGLSIYDIDKERGKTYAQLIRDAQTELSIGERLVKNKEAIKQLSEGRDVRTGRADAEVLKAQELLSKAQADLAKATNTELRKEAERQVNELKKNYDDAVFMQLTNASKELQIIRDKNIEINKIDSAINAAKAAGYEQDHIVFKFLQNAKIDAEREYQNTILKIHEDRIAKQMAMEESLYLKTLSLQDQTTLQAIGEQERQKQYIASRIEFEKKSDVEKAAFAIDQGAQMFSALGAQNKKAFEAAKAFNIANAIMNTYMAATKALASYPPPFNFIAMAAAVGMGMAQVAAIRSQQYSGRALGGPVMGGQTYMVGENGPELFTPNTTGSITRNQDLGGGGQVNVNFSINAVDTAGFDELLNSRRGLITQVISDAMMEKGQRGL